MDVANLSYELFTNNAASLNLITNDTTILEQYIQNKSSLSTLLNPLLSQRTKCCHHKHRQIIGYVCANKTEIRSDTTTSTTYHEVEDCTKTRYARDGMHWCMDEIHF